MDHLIDMLQIAAYVDRYTWMLCGMTIGLLLGFALGRR